MLEKMTHAEAVMVISENHETIERLQAENAALKLEVESLRRDAWQPIETAPKNVEIFIGSFIDEVFVFGKAVCFYEIGNELEGEFYRGWFWSIDDVCESVAECPTHWMPLPKPPAMSQGEQK